MTKQIRNIAGLAILLTAISAGAQVVHQIAITVPFPFIAAGKPCPAGEYRVGLDMGNGLVTLTTQRVRQATLLTRGSEPLRDDRSYARFRLVGDQWFLQQVAVTGQASSVALPKAVTREDEIATFYGSESAVVSSRN